MDMCTAGKMGYDLTEAKARMTWHVATATSEC